MIFNRIKELKRDGKKIGITFSTFDLGPHAGHIAMLSEAKNHCDYLIAGLQTDPTIDLTYEVLSGNPVVGWTLLFTVAATDSTSGMDRVDFYLNKVLQETVTGSGPEFEWSFIFHGGLNLEVTAFGYDIAGNIASDIIVNPRSYNYNQNTQQQKQNSESIYIFQESKQNNFVILGV